MKKLIQGIVDFRNKRLPHYKETFARLALGQSPDTLFIACSDSRVVPNLFASTEPGDLFVLRNVGNIVPPTDARGFSVADESEAAAIEFATLNLKVKDIIVCGHSECGAMIAIAEENPLFQAPHLKSWLRHADALRNEAKKAPLDGSLSFHNQISQLNVLRQLKHIATYAPVAKAIADGTLRLHGWWFDIAQAEVLSYDKDTNRFTVIDETKAQHILSKLS